MNKQILKLKEKLDGARVISQEMVVKAETNLQDELNKVFRDDDDINKAINRLENSCKYMYDEIGEIVTWVSFEVPERYENYKDELKVYIEDELHCYYATEYDALCMFQGECLIITDDGIVVTDGSRSVGNWIIDKDEYKDDEDLRNKLIEEWMENEGFFPAVLEQTYYGNLTPVNTNK